MKRALTVLTVLILSVIFIGWGLVGHRTVGSSTALFMNEEMAQFSEWPALLSSHGSDADYRKSSDPEEGPKHYIDIDNYPEFDTTGRIPSTLDSIYIYYDHKFVEDQGYLPWATEAVYDSLKACFMRRNWDKAVLFAADLGHYVADGHMPLHLTRNYDGQFTGNKGIHSRYESTMINAYSGQIRFEGDSIRKIDEVNQYIFDYIYHNYIYVDSVIRADDYASNLAGDISSNAYTNNLWEKTHSFTIPLFRNASRSLTELIYTAWMEAGKPYMDNTGIEDFTFGRDMDSASRKGIILRQNYPNPFRNSTIIQFSLRERTDVSLVVYDGYGRAVAQLLDRPCRAGNTVVNWQPEGLSPGNYYLVLKTPHGTALRRMILTD